MEMKQDLFLVKEFEKEAKERNDYILHFQSPNGALQFDTQGFDFTKVTGALLVVNGEIVPLEKTNTWASLLRSVNKALKGDRDKHDSFGEVFNLTVNNVINTFEIGMNSNFSKTLFTDDSFIRSQVYRNNKNHALEIWRGEKICAVYSGEVVIILNALVIATGKMNIGSKIDLFVSYKRRYTNELIETINEEVKKNNCSTEDIFRLLKKYEGTYQDEDGNLFQIQVSSETEKRIKQSMMESIKKIYNELGNMRKILEEI